MILKFWETSNSFLEMVWDTCFKKIYHSVISDNFNSSYPFPLIFGRNITMRISIKKWFHFPYHLPSVHTSPGETWP